MAASEQRRPAEPWIDPHPHDPPRPGTVRLPSEAGNQKWYGFSKIVPHVYVGAQLGDDHADEDHISADAAFLKERGVGALLDMRIEGHNERPALQSVGIDYHHIRVEDHFAPSMGQLDDAARYIGENVDRGTDVYVHCHAGHARSATAVMAYLIHGGRSLDDALATVEHARTISVRWNHADLDSLRDYAAHIGHPDRATPDDRLPPRPTA